MVAHSSTNIINLESSEGSKDDDLSDFHRKKLELNEIHDYIRLQNLNKRFKNKLGVDLGSSEKYHVNILRPRSYKEEKASFIRDVLKFKMHSIFK